MRLAPFHLFLEKPRKVEGAGKAVFSLQFAGLRFVVPTLSTMKLWKGWGTQRSGIRGQKKPAG
jgi:hypothetical protein